MLAPTISDLEFAQRAAVALALGSLIGIERQWRQRTAGLRTNVLVAVGTSLFIMVTPLLGDTKNATQIAAYVVSGIGFLAGSVIFKERPSVTGLNTAATLWCTAAVGVLVGYGFEREAAIGTATVLFVHVVLRPLVIFVNRRPLAESDVAMSYEFHATCTMAVEEHVRRTIVTAIRRTRMTLLAVYSEGTDGGRVDVAADVTSRGNNDAHLERVVADVATQAGVVAVSWRQVPITAEEQQLVGDA